MTADGWRDSLSEAILHGDCARLMCPGFEKIASSFGLVKLSCNAVAQEFLAWQQEILKGSGFSLALHERNGEICSALGELYPRVAPIITKYLFWPLDENWTFYFDNGITGSDAGPPCVLSSRLSVDAIRVAMVDETVESSSGRVTRYRATIFEYYSRGIERRHIFASNEGGKWRFGHSGEPFPFENVAAYRARSMQDRFTEAMLLDYLRALGVDLRKFASRSSDNQSGLLVAKRC